MTTDAAAEPRKHHQRPHRETSLSSGGSGCSSLSSFQSYPATKPFLNTEWSRSPKAPMSKAFPESNRDLILSSLRKLQEKVTRLETTNETTMYSENGSDLRRSQGYRSAAHQQLAGEDLGSMNREADSYLSRSHETSSTTERRVAELEKKLAEMRKLLNEDDDFEEMSRTATTTTRCYNTRDLNYNLPRSGVDIPAREPDFDKSFLPSPSSSSSSSSSASPASQFESDSKGFVPKLTTEEEFIDQYTPTTRRSVVVEVSSSGDEPRRRKAAPKSERSSTVKPKRRPQKLQKAEPKSNFRSKSAENLSLKSANHYRLNLGDIPFVVGKSTTPSHHLGSNIQNVISLLKQHHPKLCNSSHGSGCSGHHHHHHHVAAPVAVTTVRSSSQCRSAASKRTPSRVVHRDDEPIHLRVHTRRAEAETLKRSVSVPHFDGYERTTTGSKASARRRADAATEQKAKPMKPALKSPAPKKLNKVKETSMNFRDPQFSPSSDHKSEPNGFDLNELLKILQEEYTKLVLQHYELTKRIAACYDDLTKNELELKAEFLDQKMRIKSRQIAKLKLFKLNRALKSTSRDFKDYSSLASDENLDCGHRIACSGSIPNLDYSPKSCHNHNHLHHHHRHLDSADLHCVNHQITHQVHADHLSTHHRSSVDEPESDDGPHFHRHCHHFMTSSLAPNHQNQNLKLFKDIKNLQNRIQNDQLKL